MAKQYLRIDEKDNAIVALQDLEAGFIAAIDDIEVKLKEPIAAKHKFTLVDLEVGQPVFMYGVLVGRATRPIPQGCVLTVENVKHASENYSIGTTQYEWDAPNTSGFSNRTFNGYHRKDGSVGTANYWLVIPMVFCENRNLDVIEAALLDALGYNIKKDYTVDVQTLISKYKKGASAEEIEAENILMSREDGVKNRVFPNVDGIKFLKHNGGCGCDRGDAETLCELLAGYITNPNVAGATVLSLGCQNAEVAYLKKEIEARDSNFSKPVYFLEQQQSKSERHFIAEAVKKTFTGLMHANTIVRKPAPLSKLVLGLECGASDGFSGVSANPVLGHVSNLLVALGGSAVLSEFPELNGVEQELINRCITSEIAEKFKNLMHVYAESAIAIGSGFENNPSPGNIKDGLVTDAMKSAGAAKKGGTSPITAVLEYAEKVKETGLNLLCTPGNDVESTTGLAGSGCNLIVFTTGLGTPTGNPIAPVVKLSSNTVLYQKMMDIIDLDAGGVISGEETIKSMGEKLLDFLIAIASGKIVAKADAMGNNDFIPWKRGISL